MADTTDPRAAALALTTFAEALRVFHRAAIDVGVAWEAAQDATDDPGPADGPAYLEAFASDFDAVIRAIGRWTEAERNRAAAAHHALREHTAHLTTPREI